MTDRPTSEVLNLAADLIEHRGWTQGSGWPHEGEPDGALCLEGGICAAMGLRMPAKNFTDQAAEPLTTCPAYLAVQGYLDAQGPLWGWNDFKADSAAEVVEVLRATAVIEAARESEAAQVSA